MQNRRDIPLWAFELALVAVTIIWGASFLVLKGALNSMTPGWLLAVRFALAALALAIPFGRRIAAHLDAAHLRAGLLIGLPEGLAFLIQNVGLVDTTPGRNAFLTGTYCVMVPFLAWLATGLRPRMREALCAILCLAGIGLVSLRGDLTLWLSRGDVLTLVGAVFFAVNILCVDWFGQNGDFITVTFVELVVMAVVCLAGALVSEPLPRLANLAPGFWGQMAYVALGSSTLAMLLQNLAQRHVPSHRAALLMSLESVFATAFSIAFYGERLSPAVAMGFVLIFASVVASQLAQSQEGEVVA